MTAVVIARASASLTSTTRSSPSVITGAAGGITSAIVADLAAASAGTFVLLDLVAEPARDDARIALFRQDREQLKRTLIDEARAKGEKPTPVMIDKQIMAIERSEAALRAIETVESEKQLQQNREQAAAAEIKTRIEDLNADLETSKTALMDRLTEEARYRNIFQNAANNKESLQRRLKRAGIRIPNLQRPWSLEEFDALLERPR